MAKITKTGWVLPHGNKKFNSTQEMTEAVYALNESKFIETADLLEVPLDVVKNMFEDELTIKFHKHPGTKWQDAIVDITNSRAFTTEEDMAFANLEDILTNSNNWQRFKKLAKISNKGQYDPSLWEYKNGVFIYNSLVAVHFAGNYHEELNINPYL